MAYATGVPFEYLATLPGDVIDDLAEVTAAYNEFRTKQIQQMAGE